MLFWELRGGNLKKRKRMGTYGVVHKRERQKWLLL